MDKACIGSLLYPIAAGVWLMFGEELIDTDRLLTLVHLYTEVFIELIVIRLLDDIAVGHQFQFVILQIVHHSVTSSNSSTLPLSIILYSGSI